MLTETQQLRKTPISSLALEHPGLIDVFRKFRINYASQGKLTFNEACRRAGADEISVLIAMQEAANNEMQVPLRTQDWSLELIHVFIVQNHHRYVRRAGPELVQALTDLELLHTIHHADLASVRLELERFLTALEEHMRREELVIFPAIQWLVQQHRAGASKITSLGFRLGYSVKRMESEHDDAVEDFNRIRTLACDFEAPAWCGPAYGALMQRLQEFEADLHTHMHLENNVLFPKALALEASLLHETELTF
ncbi:MAG: hemerythrin domain-containing protein [Cyclobacteriaceae bacterium]